MQGYPRHGDEFKNLFILAIAFRQKYCYIYVLATADLTTLKTVV